MPSNGFDDPVSLELVPHGEGTVLGARFKLLRFIGSGTVGAVYEAYDANRSERVAIKIFFPALTKDANTRESLVEVVRLNSGLKHPGITRVFEVHEVDGFLCQSMDLEGGGSLRDWIARHGETNSGDAGVLISGWIPQILTTLETVSDVTCHLSIKPENLFPQEDGSIKVADFGFQACLDRLQASFTTLVTSSVCYQAPELLEDDDEPGAKADQFSVAAVYYELLAGAPPIGAAPSLRQIRPNVPGRLQGALEKALAANAEERFATLADFAATVESADRYPRWLRQGANGVATVLAVFLIWAGAAVVLPDSTVGRLFHSLTSTPSTEHAANSAQSLWDQIALVGFECDQISENLGRLIVEAKEGASSKSPRIESLRGDDDFVSWSRWAHQGWAITNRAAVQDSLTISLRDLESGNWERVIDRLDPVREFVVRQRDWLFERHEYLDQFFEARQLAIGLAGLEDSDAPVKRWTQFNPTLDSSDSLAERGRMLSGTIDSMRNRASLLLTEWEQNAEESRNAFLSKVGPFARLPHHLGDPEAIIAKAKSITTPEQWGLKRTLFQEAISQWAAWEQDYNLLPSAKETEWENSLGMRFVELSPGLWISVFETRLIDFESFIQHSGFDADRHWRWLHDEFIQTSPFEPAVNLLRDNCDIFCEWLTNFERAQGMVNVRAQYRLPTAEEWGLAAGASVGLDLKDGGFPVDVQVRNNLPGQEDGFQFTAPVGRYQPNALGLYDMEGNVAEWCREYTRGLYSGIVRGGSWRRFRVTNELGSELPSTRHLYRDLGFRVVLDRRKS